MEASQEEPLFGENIDKSLFEENLVKMAYDLRKQGKSVFHQQEEKNEMTQKKVRYVLISICDVHASIVVVDKELFDTILFPLVTWGHMIDGPSLVFRDDFEAAKRMGIPFKQYHVCLRRSDKEYYLTWNDCYMSFLKKSRSFFVGESAMDDSHLRLLCLTVVPLGYRLIMDDCLEFAKRFATEIALEENGIQENEIRALFRTLSVCENYTSAAVEQSSRNNPKSGLSAAFSFFTSFRSSKSVR
ncbi:uncharacterized protein [Acropora muricata]|uniref:uncharacterized protein LOC122952570 n=1 Tax=Acropora millepora TaxID=45264 RepID=UPI001CF49F6F|nr:uncharacterized protein LOC122952570 [Acropora millepora]